MNGVRNLNGKQALGVGCLAVIVLYGLMFLGLMALIFVYAVGHASSGPG